RSPAFDEDPDLHGEGRQAAEGGGVRHAEEGGVVGAVGLVPAWRSWPAPNDAHNQEWVRAAFLVSRPQSILRTAAKSASVGTLVPANLPVIGRLVRLPRS